uniref:kelch-like protein 38 isoform X3 n=1 Tax=Styela clava TaxID=7725 RepID=UPI001939B791|nr:kelch-like protein 38 isoform X3 [Styela clava]
MKMNSKVIDQARAKQSDRLMTSYDRFKEKGFLCDFNINVGEISFRVHRTVLAASSEYFESMFSSNLKEVHDGHVNMKDVNQNGIAQCVEFMYKGKADLKIENIQHILHASNLLQMEELTNLCFQFLEINISPINCLSVINLAQMYDRLDIKQQAVQVVIDNFESVISSEMFPFITKSDLLHYISNQTYQTLWKAVVTWAKGKDNVDVSELFKIEQFPFKFLLETVLKEPIVKNNKTAEKSVITALFSDVKKLETNLDIDNCFILKNLSETNQTPKQTTVKDSIILFLETNFEQISKKKEFLDISKDDILRLFKYSETKYSSEAIKYEGMMKWVKHDVKNRRKIFQDLFSLLKLGDLSLEFLKETVRIEPLVKKSDKCNDLLIDEIFSRASLKAEEKPKAEQPLALPVSSSLKDDEEGYSASGYGTASSRPANGSVVRSAPEKEVVKVKEEFEERMKQMELKYEQEKRKMEKEIERLKGKTKGAESQSSSQTKSGLRIINQQPSDGKWSWDWLQESLPGYEGEETFVITYSFPAGSLKVSYETNLFVG